MIEFKVAAHTYRARKIDTFTQFHVARRLAPVFSSLTAAGLKDMEGLAGALGPLSTAIASIPDADADYVLKSCLGVCDRRQKGATGWAAVQPQGAGLMFEDIDLAVMLQIVWKVLEANLSGFFSALPQTSAAPEASPEA